MEEEVSLVAQWSNVGMLPRSRSFVVCAVVAALRLRSGPWPGLPRSDLSFDIRAVVAELVDALA